jgi:hypothetical protein
MSSAGITPVWSLSKQLKASLISSSDVAIFLFVCLGIAVKKPVANVAGEPPLVRPQVNRLFFVGFLSPSPF